MYKYVFGPIKSRRFGLSLGIDLLGSKICSMNCPYCEIEKTTSFTFERRPYVKADYVIKELSSFLSDLDNIDFNMITFSGKGEPLLNSEIEKVINYIKDNYNYKVCILTNGSYLNDRSVRNEIKNADLIVPSLDAISARAFRKVNIPHRSLKVTDIIDGIIALRKEFTGQLWIEILFVRGLNDSDEEVRLLKQKVLLIQPDRVYINTVYRPPAFLNVKPIASDKLDDLQNQFNDLIINKSLDVFASDSNSNLSKNFIVKDFSEDFIKKKLMMILNVRPSSYEDLKRIFFVNSFDMDMRFNKVLNEIILDDNVFVEYFDNHIYYSVLQAF